MTEVLTHTYTGEIPPSDRETLDFMASGGEISLGDIPDDELERGKPTSNIDYNELVFAIIDSIHRQGGDDTAVNEKFDSELTEFLYFASLSYDVVLNMDEADATKAIKNWHPWQNDLHSLLKDSRRVLSVRATLKPVEEQVQAAA
jgi:hypothetical protein